MWPTDPDQLAALQRSLARAQPEPWRPPASGLRVGACWVCFPRGGSGAGAPGDPAWAASVVTVDGAPVETQVVTGAAGASYVPGLLALRVGPLMEAAVRRLHTLPEVVLVDGTGRDHPRRAGLALHLGAELDLPSVGVTHRPLMAHGGWPDDVRGATSPLLIGPDRVGSWLRTRPGTRPLAVHPGWRVDLHTAVEVVLGASRHRTPEPLRLARHAARLARADATGR